MQTFPEYWDYVENTFTSANGVFGLKSSWMDLKPVIEYDFIEPVIKSAKTIYLDRRDIVLQAISAYKASCRNIFHVQADANVSLRKVPYNEEKILLFIRWLINEKNEWHRLFLNSGIQPYRLFYEDFVVDPQKYLDEIIRFFEIPNAAPCKIGTAPLQKLGNDEDVIWANSIRQSSEFSLVMDTMIPSGS